MNDKLIGEIKEKLKKKLNPERFDHTIGVAYTAAALAMKYGVDMEKAFLAGLLHDCVKYMSNEKLLKKSLEYTIEISDSELMRPDLLHAKLGAYYAEHKYGISDPEICHAIRCHTTGTTEMNLLDMILYVADYIEPNRVRAPKLPYYRELAFSDIKRCTYEILKNTIDYVNSKKQFLDSATVAAYDALKIAYEKDME